MPSSILSEARQRADHAGLNLFGLVGAARYDACQPSGRRVGEVRQGCGTVLVLGTGGRHFWQRYRTTCGGADRGVSAAGAERFAQESARDLAAWLAMRGVTGALIEPGAHAPLRFACLGEAAGLGVVSPVTGYLLHPVFGSWLALRAVLLLDGEPFGTVANASIAHRFQPCCGCARPCLQACAPQALDGAGGLDLRRCGEHRHAGNCESGCGARLACPVGADHRDGPGEHAHGHEQPLPQVRRQLGLGLWRLLPRGLRG